PGTPAALEAEVDALNVPGKLRESLERFDQFAAAHPGTTAAAKALYEKGFQWANNAIGTLEARGADPTPRLFTILEIVRELESGRYPPCRWVSEAPYLIVEFHTYQQSYAP